MASRKLRFVCNLLGYQVARGPVPLVLWNHEKQHAGGAWRSSREVFDDALSSCGGFDGRRRRARFDVGAYWRFGVSVWRKGSSISLETDGRRVFVLNGVRLVADNPSGFTRAFPVFPNRFLESS